jgi:hypothetical protein
VSLGWLASGRSLGGLALHAPMDRTEALRLWTEGSAWFSGDETHKGRIEAGRLADLAVLSADYFAIPEPEIGRLESVLTVVDGRIVHAGAEFAPLAPALPPASPSWSPAAPRTQADTAAPRAAGCACAAV